MNLQDVLKAGRLFTKERWHVRPGNANELHENALSFQDKMAVWITGAIGTMYAVYFFAIFMGVWMLWQLMLNRGAFDPYPFAFLLFIGNIIQLLLMPLIMVGQNIQNRHAEIRAEEQYKATLAGYKDAEHIMDHLVALDRELLAHRELLARIIASVDGGDVLESGSIQGIHVDPCLRNTDQDSPGEGKK